ncbi:MAG: MotA/TolQ/ExbB proton channel family protein [Bacteroidota bacterium]|nr:MotA/TolQ/ExbB proton channel family protein [Bacteroidota bacterium]
MNKTSKKSSSNFSGMFAGAAILICLIVGHLIFHLIMGNGANFEGGTNEGHPLPGNYLGIVYKGGFIVPVLMSFFLIVFVVSIERFLTLGKASGAGSIESFVFKVRDLLSANNIDGAIAECDKQKGSVGNVVRATLEKYREMTTATNFDKDQKIAAIQKQTEEATSLELPMLEKNLSILSTLASVATLVALLGTVLGMIRAFAAMSSAGAPDATALATGISEALINTAIGIGTSAISIICYNFFTTKIDGLSYTIDEAGLSIASTFNTNYK